jgi:hypothetical protein
MHLVQLLNFNSLIAGSQTINHFIHWIDRFKYTGINHYCEMCGDVTSVIDIIHPSDYCTYLCRKCFISGKLQKMVGTVIRKEYIIECPIGPSFSCKCSICDEMITCGWIATHITNKEEFRDFCDKCAHN